MEKTIENTYDYSIKALENLQGQKYKIDKIYSINHQITNHINLSTHILDSFNNNLNKFKLLYNYFSYFNKEKELTNKKKTELNNKNKPELHDNLSGSLQNIILVNEKIYNEINTQNKKLILINNNIENNNSNFNYINLNLC